MCAIRILMTLFLWSSSIHASPSFNLEAFADSIARNHPPSSQEQIWLDKKPTVRFRVIENPPEQFIENGKPEGVSIDYAKLVCKTYQIDCQFVPLLGGTFFVGLA